MKNALKLLVLAAVCGAAAAQNATNITSVTDSLDNVSLRELVTQAKAAVASNPDLAALFAGIGDVNALSDADLAKLVKEILAVTADGSLAGSGSKANSSVGSNSTTTTTAPTVAPVTAPQQSAAPAVFGLAPAVVVTLVASVAFTLL